MLRSDRQRTDTPKWEGAGTSVLCYRDTLSVGISPPSAVTSAHASTLCPRFPPAGVPRAKLRSHCSAGRSLRDNGITGWDNGITGYIRDWDMGYGRILRSPKTLRDIGYRDIRLRDNGISKIRDMGYLDENQ